MSNDKTYALTELRKRQGGAAKGMLENLSPVNETLVALRDTPLQLAETLISDQSRHDKRGTRRPRGP